MKLSRLVEGVELSATLAIDARAKALAAEGRDVLNMSAGELDFPAPAAVQGAAVEKIRSGDVRYTPAPGTPELREAIASHLSETRGVPFGPEEVTVCHSAKHALSGALLALVGPGDEVLIPLPAWVSYFALVQIAGGTPVEVPPAPGCRPDLGAIAAAITDRTRAILLNSPCNPSGYVYTPEEIRTLADLAVERGVAIVSDEIYRRLVHDGPPAVSPASEGPQARARTVIVDGASKAFAMTGYRIGFVAGPAGLASAVARLHSQMTGSPNAVSQAAYRAALLEEPPEVERMRRELVARRDLLLAGLAGLGLETPRPRGAFYAFPEVSRHLDGRGSVGFCEDLLEREGLAIVPGKVFGLDAHVRLSYAVDIERIRDALGRLGRFLGRRGDA